MSYTHFVHLYEANKKSSSRPERSIHIDSASLSTMWCSTSLEMTLIFIENQSILRSLQSFWPFHRAIRLPSTYYQPRF